MTTKKNQRSARVRFSGKAVRDLRSKLGVDVAALAAALSVHPSTVYRWETTKWPALSRAMIDTLAAAARLSDPDLAALGARIRTAAIKQPLAAARLLLDAASKAPAAKAA